jgi:rhamnose transport system substrate-binding protein
MRRTGALLLAAGLSLAVLTACGGGSEPTNTGSGNSGSGSGSNSSDQSGGGGDKAYCDAVKAAGTELLKPAPSGGTKDLAAPYQKIADVAPDDIKPHWQTLADQMKVLQEGLKIDPEAIATTDPADLEAQQKKTEEASKKVQEAITKVTDDTSKRCVNA